MRESIRKLGHIKMVLIVTVLAIILALTLEFALYKICDITYPIPYTPLVTATVTTILTPLISWYFFKLIFVLDKLEQEMYHLATFDSMTKMLSRQAFFNRSLNLHQKAKEHESPYSICIIDIDNFKAINDTYGHACGDQVLMHFGKLIHRTLGKECIAGRIGGEEFAIVFQVDAHTCKNRIDALHQNISNASVHCNDASIPFTISIGIYENKQPKVNTFDEALSFADDALYDAKATGKNRTVIYSDKLSTKNIAKKSTYIRNRKS